MPSRRNTHVQIDKRFAHMLRDDGFSSKTKVDRHGRKLLKNSGLRELKNYYRLAEDADVGSDGDEVIQEELEKASARDDIASSTSSDDRTSEEEGVDSAEENEVFGLLDEQGTDGKGVPMGEASPRIAVVNLDWDNIRAIDLMAVFSSFAPSGGRIMKISVYPSDFGRERMEREDLEGPPKDIFGAENATRDGTDMSDSEGDLSEDPDEEKEEEDIRKSLLREDNGEDFNSTKLRRYQLERLRYYFAVLVCSSTPVAQAIYNAVDGTEYLTTANFFDLRFIPDHVNFAADKARDECERVPDGYRPNEFITDALQHSKVRLTWDADDGTRKEAQKRAFGGSRTDIDENDLKAYIGSDSSDDEVPEPAVVNATSVEQPEESIQDLAIPSAVSKLPKKDTERQRMRALLGLGFDPAFKKSSRETANGPVGDMQITFSSGLSNMNKGSVFENEPERDETTVEKYVRKEKERKNRRKEKMKDVRDAGGSSAAVDEVKDKARSPKPDQKDLGFSDPFFTDPSTNNESLKARKRSQRHADLAAACADDTESRRELEQLVKDDNAVKGGQVHHFDTTLLAKGEKLASKKGIHKKKHKISERQKEALEAKAQDDFRIDTQDPRFRAVFKRSEYAIDPSHKGFKDTEGMQALLEAGRKKRRRDEEEIGPGIGVSARTRKQVKVKPSIDRDDTRNLVEKVKARSRVA